MANKLKIGFDIDSWSKQDYRDLINDMNLDIDEIELYLITKETDLKEIDDLLELDSDHVEQVLTNQEIVNSLETNNVSIYLTTDNELVDFINISIPLQLDINLGGCQAILVNNIPDIYKFQPKYITHLQFWLKEIGKIN